MTNKQKILQSISPVLEKSKNVKVNNKAVQNFAASVTENELSLIEYSAEQFLTSASEKEHVAFLILYQSLNFCFWGDPKWAMIDEAGKRLGGSYSLLYALKKAIESGIDLLNPEVLENLTMAETKKVFAAEVEIPLIDKRQLMMNKLGFYIKTKYEGSFDKLIEALGNDSNNMVRVLTSELPDIFADEANYKGNTVYFYKRAQLVPHHMYKLKLLGLIKNEVKNLQDLTALADYKGPQMLRKYNILEYSDELANKIDTKQEIPAGSEEEIEIRAHMIHAFELIVNELRPRFEDIVSFTVNDILWLKSQDKSQQDKPYHRTRTHWY